MKKHVAAAICGDAGAFPNPCMADGSGKRTRSLRAPSRRGVRAELGEGGAPVALDRVEYKVSIKSSVISRFNSPLRSPLRAPSYLLSYWILYVIGWCCVLMSSDDNSSDADYRIGKIPILLPLRIRCVIGLLP
jgi:hypothetical protein